MTGRPGIGRPRSFPHWTRRSPPTAPEASSDLVADPLDPRVGRLGGAGPPGTAGARGRAPRPPAPAERASGPGGRAAVTVVAGDDDTALGQPGAGAGVPELGRPDEPRLTLVEPAPVHQR